MIRRLLIANRGEIACRIIRTCRRLGMASVAVFSEADAMARHVREADEAWPIGPAEPERSYLDQAAILEAARRAGADAIHPGYGFLAENAVFARACEAVGRIFVGPPADAIEAMGAKDKARAIAVEAGVPVLPGEYPADSSMEGLAAAAHRVGFPLMVKPVAGGGGKGMRIVRAVADLDDALAAARREAEAAFGDGRLLLERFLDRPRHIEVQVMGDRFGKLVHLLERDCSLQRRHQKILEEAPAPGFDEPLRRRLAEAALKVARAVGYANAGTVEFILDEEGGFHFIEMNTRLQVEHPVTEAITGLDLVEWQLRLAAGEPLSLNQGDIRASGHAIEVRIYAENPERDFLPSSGRVGRLRWPEGCRVDAGIEAGDRVAADYDPMIAKLVVHAPDRPAAIARLRAALAATRVEGVATNLAFLARVARAEAFETAAIASMWLDRESPQPPALPLPPLAVAALAAVAYRRRIKARGGAWDQQPGFRLNGPARHLVRLAQGSDESLVIVEARGRWHRLTIGDTVEELILTGETADRLWIEHAGRVIPLEAEVDAEAGCVLVAGGAERYEMRESAAMPPSTHQAPGTLAAPMPGRITEVRIAVGDMVAAGTVLAILEAMKMEHRFTAPQGGTVAALHVAPGDRVEEGMVILELTPQEPAP